MIKTEDLALSTMWNYPTARSGEEMVDTILQAGFTRVELNYQVKPAFYPAILAAVRAGRIQAVSVHNVFPKTDDSRFDTDSMLLGYQDETLRRMAVELTKRTLDHAAELGAKAVVVHPTEVPLSPDAFDHPLKKLIRKGRRSTPEYHVLLQRLLEQRKAGPYLDALRRSLDELCEYIVSQGYAVYLGMENRSMCHQIPIFSEFETILHGFEGSAVRVWLDTGHAIMMEEIGLQQMPPPKTVTDAIIGMHIHDAALGRDYYPPGSLPGMPLKPFLPLIERAPVKVLEISSRCSASQAAQGAQWLAAQAAF